MRNAIRIMAESEMVDVLKKLGLPQFIPKFLEEKITPDIVCKLSSYEFRFLGIAVSSDIMSHHVYCSKYGRYIPQKLPNQSGALEFNIPKVYALKYIRRRFYNEGNICNYLCGKKNYIQTKE